MTEKICPLLSTASAPIIQCLGECCAWYVPPVLTPSGAVLREGRCAVPALGVLPYLAEGVRRL